MWGWDSVETLWQDLRYGLRMLGKSPGFTTVAVLTLALGIGANTAVFALINALMLRSLPVEKPQQLYFFGEDNGGGTYAGALPTGSLNLFSYHFYKEFRERNIASFEDVAAFSSTQVTLRVGGVRSDDLPSRVDGVLVTGNYFRVLGVNAVAGRTLQPDDDREGDPRAVAVVSYHYWAQNLGRDPGVVGKTLEIDHLPFTLVGVAPADFFGVKLTTNPPDFWIPLGWQPQAMAELSRLKNLDVFWLDVFGRLKPGVNPSQGAAAITGQAQQMLAARAGSNLDSEHRRRIQQTYVQLIPGARGLSGLRARFSERLKVLTLLVALVLVIACLNTANLLLARAAARQREMAVRLAVGAGRGRLTRQLLTESVLLGGFSGLAGMLLAFWGTRLLSGLVFGGNATLPFSLHPDLRVLGFTALVSLLTGIAFGFAPAFRSARVDLNSSLKEIGRSAATAASRSGRFASGKLLVSGQVTVSLSLLMVAGLFVRSLRKLEQQDLGFSPEHVLVCSLDIGAAGYKPEQLPALYQRLLDRVRALPGVRSAALASRSVLGHSIHTSNISIQGSPPRSDGEMNTERKTATDSYFETDGMTLLLGRPITRDDTKDSPRVAVVNQTFAERYFPNQNPLGRHFNYGSPFSAPGLEIVGVVADAKYDSLSDTQAPPMTFVPVDQELEPGEYADDLELRVAGDPKSAVQGVRRAVAEVDRDIMVGSVHPLGELVKESAHDARLIAQLSSFFGLLALLLAAIGLYGVMAYNVMRRTGEIGIRMALGAEAGRVLWMVMSESLLVVALGIALGVPAALGLGRLVSSQLFDLSPGDPVTLIIATLLLIATSALASYVPARRAAKVDPMVALRYE
jgi:predicted permease